MTTPYARLLNIYETYSLLFLPTLLRLLRNVQKQKKTRVERFINWPRKTI